MGGLHISLALSKIVRRTDSADSMVVAPRTPGETHMRNKISACTLVLFMFATVLPMGVLAAEPQWKASWITHPTAPLREPIVLHFRRGLQLESTPARYVVHVSADNRFILYING